MSSDYESRLSFSVKLRITLVLFLAVSLTAASVWYMTSAVPAPTGPGTAEPGSYQTSCTWAFYIDGSTYLAKDCAGGGNTYVGTNFRAVFQNAVAQKVGLLFFGSGTFTVTKQIIHSEEVGLSVPDNVIIQGSGRGLTVIRIANSQFSGGTQAAAVIANSNWNLGSPYPNFNITIRDITVDANMANQGVPSVGGGQQIGILYDPVIGGTIENVEVKNFNSWGIGIYSAETLIGAGPRPVKDVVRNVWVHHGGHGDSSSGFDSGIFISYHRISNTVIDTFWTHDINGYGVVLEDLPGGIIVKNGYIFNNQGDGIRLFLTATGSPYSTNGTIIADNFIYRNGGIANQGSGIYADASGTGLQIRGNSIFENERYGIIVSARYGPSYGVIISNNVIFNNFQAATGADIPGLMVLGDSLSSRQISPIITGNVMFDDQAVKTQYRAYGNGNYVVNATLTGNSFCGNLNPPSITGSSYWWIANNACYNPQPISSISVGASVFTYTNNDGYSEVIQMIGGTVSSIIFIRLGVSIDLGLGTGTYFITLDPRDALQITYSSVPTMRKIPL